MVTIQRVSRAIVPVDAHAAARITAPNYDEFQGAVEVWKAIQENPASVLRVTMAHCDADDPEYILEGDSAAALDRARSNFEAVRESPATREEGDFLYVYEILDPRRPQVRQIGLGGMAKTSEILTDSTPRGTIIRNEGVRIPKARGRANLIEATNSIIGGVNNAVPDVSGEFTAALERHVEGVEPDLVSDGAGDTRHSVWLVKDRSTCDELTELLATQEEAYVADGNHRSAAAAMLGHELFLAVFFPASRVAIYPYNRIVRLGGGATIEALEGALEAGFDVTAAGPEPLQPTRTHEIGVYTGAQGWRLCIPRAGQWDPKDAAASIDHDIVQHLIFSRLGMEDPGDKRLTFVGANKSAGWLARAVDQGNADVAVTLPAVTMKQFVDVCRQRRMMPPKSTWFEPKIRSGFVMPLLNPA